MKLYEIVCEGVIWIHLAQGSSCEHHNKSCGCNKSGEFLD
jgi:hypothetical protein